MAKKLSKKKLRLLQALSTGPKARLRSHRADAFSSEPDPLCTKYCKSAWDEECVSLNLFLTKRLSPHPRAAITNYYLSAAKKSFTG